MITLQKRTLPVHLLIFLLSTLVLFTSCKNTRNPSFFVGVSQCTYDEWRQKMNSEMQREAMLSHVISLELKNAGGNSKQQVEDVKYFIDKNVDLIIVSPNETEALTPVVAKAYDSGIPVIVVDRNVSGDKFTAFIGADNVEVGRIQGQYIRNALPDGGRIIEIRGLSGSSPAIERHQGLIEALEENSYDGNIEIVASVDAEWQEPQAIHLMDSLLRIYPDVDLVSAQNDRMAKGAYKAANALCPDNSIIMLGVDAVPGREYGLQDVLDGELQATVSYPTGGEEVIDLALKILLDIPYSKITILETNLVEKENAELINRFARMIHDQELKVETLNHEVDFYMRSGVTLRRMIAVCIVLIIIILIISILVFRSYRQRFKQNELLKFFTNDILDLHKQGRDIADGENKQNMADNEYDRLAVKDKEYDDEPDADENSADGYVVSEEDVQFINHLQKYINDHIDDSTLSVETMGESLGMSRTQLYRKVKAISHSTPVEVIRAARLTKARKLLEETELSISEITYLTGFSSPSYFTKCYREYFGEIPTAIRQNSSIKNVAQQN